MNDAEKNDCFTSLDSDEEPEREMSHEELASASPTVTERRPVVRAKASNYLSEDNFDADTADYEDHTFSGIMFDVRCKSELPVEFIEIHSVWVRGALGLIRIFTAQGSHTRQVGNRGIHIIREEWQQHFEQELPESMNHLTECKVDPPIRLLPGDVKAVYVHSALNSDQGIVYGDQHSVVTHDTRFVAVLPGLAQVSNVPFAQFGNWGNCWRRNRQFCGRLSYGVKWKLWHPEVHRSFGNTFQKAVLLMLWCNRQRSSVISLIPEDSIYHILHFCGPDWFASDEETEKLKRDAVGVAVNPRFGDGTEHMDRHSYFASYISALLNMGDGEGIAAGFPHNLRDYFHVVESDDEEEDGQGEEGQGEDDDDAEQDDE